MDLKVNPEIARLGHDNRLKNTGYATIGYNAIQWRIQDFIKEGANLLFGQSPPLQKKLHENEETFRGPPPPPPTDSPILPEPQGTIQDHRLQN